MTKKLLVAIVLLLQIELLFAQNSPKPPNNPFSFGNARPISRENVVQNNLPVLAVNPNFEQTAAQQDNTQNTNENNLKKLEQSEADDLSKKVTDTFEDKMNDYSTKLIPHTLKLFYMLLILSIILTVIIQMILGSHFKDIVTSLLVIFFMAGFFELLIKNWVEWSNWIVMYFKDIGENVSQVKLQPSAIIKYSMNYITNVYENLTFTKLGQSLMYVFLAIPTFFLIIQMVAIYIFALLEFIIIGKLSVIYLAFAGIKFTEGYAKKPLMYCLACGLKLMFLQLFFGGALSIIADFSTKQMSIQLAMVMFICSVILNLLVERLPQLVDTFIHGTTSATMGGNISHMTKALGNVALSTAKAVMSAIDNRDFVKNASEASSTNGAKYNHNAVQAMEASYQKHKEDVLSKSTQSGLKESGKSSLNQNKSSNLGNQNNSDINPTSSLDTNKNQQTTSTNNSASTFGNSFNNPNSSDKSKVNNSTSLNGQISSDTSNKSQSSNQSTLGKVGGAALHGIKTAGNVAGALIRNDFNLDKANQHLKQKIYEKQNLNAAQEKLWDKIYSGNSPDNYDQAKKYIEHGNKMEKDKKYASDFSDYVQYRKQVYQNNQNQIESFAQDINNIVQTNPADTQTSIADIKKDNPNE